VAGGGPGWRVAGSIHAALYSVLNAVLLSALRDWFGPQSSIQSSAIDSAIAPSPFPVRFRSWEFIFPQTQFFLELSRPLGI
jgi:hypothetical protein